MKKRQLLSYPKIFLFDGLGALLTAFILGVIFTNMQGHIGMPRGVLISLAITAFIFSIYSFSCFLFLKSNRKPFLKAIALVNLLYCVITSILIILLFQQLTIWELIYFVGEIVVIGILVYFELSIVNTVID